MRVKVKIPLFLSKHKKCAGAKRFKIFFNFLVTYALEIKVNGVLVFIGKNNWQFMAITD